MIPHRFFKATDGVYEDVRTTLNAAWGLPNNLGTRSCFPAVESAPHDSEGRAVVAVLPEWCDWEPASTLLPQLLASGAVTEIDAAEYAACLDEVD